MSTFLRCRILLAGLLSAAVAGQAQSRKAIDKVEDEILRDGLTLYQSERAAWVGTDLLMVAKHDRRQLAGYVSYVEGDSARCVFFRKTEAGEPLMVQHAYSFPRREIRPATTRENATARLATAVEQRLLRLKQAAKEELSSYQKLGEPYRVPKNASLNIALLEKGNTTQAYVLTGPREGGLVPIGNDYLLTLDSRTAEVKQAEKLHNSYLPLQPDSAQSTRALFHTHLPAHPYITPSDICTTLLYHDQVPTEQHYVMGQDFVSVLDLSQDPPQLLVMTRKAWNKTSKNFKQ